MKIFKFLTIASIGLISLGFTSCSDDDDTPAENKPEELTVKKRLKSMTYVEDNRTPTCFSDFTYYSDGRILSYKESRESSIGGTPTVIITTITYDYSDDKITISEQQGGYTHTCDYIISDGYIRALEDGSYINSYTYDKNQLKRYTLSLMGGPADTTYEWGTGVKRTVYKYFSQEDQEEDVTYTYIDKICPSSMIYYGFEDLLYYGCDIDPLLADVGYFGEKLMPKLLGEYSLQHSDGRIWGGVFAYEFDNDGYVTSMTVVGTGERVGRDCKYTYVWE